MWKRILKLAHHAGFTRNEAAVILFLAATLLSGATLRSFQRDDGSTPKDVREALARQDSVFAEKAAASAIEVAAQGSEAASQDPDAAMKKAKNRTVEGAPSSVNLNTAMTRELETLPGIGPSTAENIIGYRRDHGRFSRIEDVMKVKGIGPKKFEKIRQFITVE